MLEGLLAILTGGASGLLGTALSGGMAHFESKRKHAQELELRKLDMEMAAAETAAANTQAALEAENNALMASYSEASKRLSAPGESGWLVAVDVVRGLTRPVLTLLFVVLAGGMFFTLSDAALEARIVDTVLYLTTTCVIWWFGGRRKAGG